MERRDDMARLLEIEDAGACPSPLVVRAGDVLLLRAAGARILSGADDIELLGPFVTAVLGSNGEVLSPIGPPGAVLVVTRRLCRASIVATTGDPFHATQSIELTIVVKM